MNFVLDSSVIPYLFYIGSRDIFSGCVISCLYRPSGRAYHLGGAFRSVMESPFSKLAFNSARPWREKRNSLEVPPNSFLSIIVIMETDKIAIFKGKQIRRIISNNEWWFSVVDVVGALTDSSNPNDYWYRMKVRVKIEDGIELSTICRQLKLDASDGKNTKLTVPTPRKFSESYSRFHRLKPNRLSVGWQK